MSLGGGGGGGEGEGEDPIEDEVEVATEDKDIISSGITRGISSQETVNLSRTALIH